MGPILSEANYSAAGSVLSGKSSRRTPDMLVCYSRNNFGDQLSSVIAHAVIAPDLPVWNMATENRQSQPAGNAVVGLGSILHFATAGDIIWGTGVVPKRFPPPALRWWSQLRRVVAPSWDIRAVRGPLTRKFLIEQLGVGCPEVYGDPALLLPEILPHKNRHSQRAYGVIPHYRDLPIVDDPNVCNPLRPWEDVLDFILECDLVIASSLHGLIVAEAFGIPARWLHHTSLPSADSEGTYKYADYYTSSGRDPACYAGSIEEAIRLGGMPIPDVVPAARALRESISGGRYD